MSQCLPIEVITRKEKLASETLNAVFKKAHISLIGIISQQNLGEKYF